MEGAKIEDHEMDYDFRKAMYEGKISERIFHKKRVKTVLEMVDYSDKKVLDLGCNSGIILIPLTEKNIDIVGSDISIVSIKQTKKYLLEKELPFKLLLCDGKNLPFKNDSFDVLLLTDILEHVAHPEIFVEEARKVLKKNGEVVVSVPWEYHPIVKFKFFRKLFSRRNDIDDSLDLPFSFSMLDELFAKFSLKRRFLGFYWVDICAVFKKE